MPRLPMLPALAVTVALFAVACGDGFGSTVTAPNSGDRATGSASAAEPPPRESAAGTPAAPAAPATNAPAAPDASAPTKPASPAPDLSPAGVVTRAYQLALERAPDADGLAFWVDQLGAGTTKLAVLRALVTSDEFAARHAAKSDVEYVVYLYTRFLRRAPAADEVDFWAKSLASGTSRRLVADAFVTSVEFASGTNPDFAFFF